MDACMGCFRRMWGVGPDGTGHVRLEDLPNVKLDSAFTSIEVVIIKNGKRICGTGGALANAPLVQNKSYFELKVQCTGIWGVGVANKHCNVNTIPFGCDTNSWVLRHDGALYHNSEVKGRLPRVPEDGDIVAVSYDHIELNFYVNGQAMSIPITGIKGTVFPAFYVDDGATLDVQFSNFYHPPPPGYEEIMLEKSLL